MKIIKQILGMFKGQTRQEYIESYLSKSVDRYDLEARQRELSRKGIY